MKPYPYYRTRDVCKIGDIVTWRVANTPEKDAFRVRTGKDSYRGITWKQFADDINALGTALFARGLKGAHIGVVGENSYEWMLVYFTALMADMVIVPLDRELPAEKLGELIAFSDAKAVVFSKAHAGGMQQLKAGGLDCDFICMADVEGFPPLAGLVEQGNALLAEGNRDYLDCAPDTEALAAIYFTSGTSGDQKGVMLSQKNMVASFDGAAQHILFTDDDVFLSVLPLHHAYESNCGILATLHSGATICFNASLKQFMQNLQLFKPTGLSLVPLITDTMYKQVMETARKGGKLKKLQFGMKLSGLLQKCKIDITEKLFGEVHAALGGRFKAFVGGAPMNPNITRAFRKMGIVLLQGYGITECSPLVCVNRDRFYNDDSAGPVLPTCEVRIHNGEIQVRGGNVMLGYYKNPQATEEAFEDGWFKTGDLGHVDQDGFLCITGRKKNLIILDSGENISPEELEGYIIDLPLVREVVVYEAEGKITAEIFPDAEYAQAMGIADVQSELKRQVDVVNAKLPRYKHILAVKCREDEFEKTTSKKIIRHKVNGGGGDV